MSHWISGETLTDDPEDLCLVDERNLGGVLPYPRAQAPASTYLLAALVLQ